MTRPMTKAELVDHVRAPHHYTNEAGQARSIESAEAPAVLRRFRLDELVATHDRLHEHAGTETHR